MSFKQLKHNGFTLIEVMIAVVLGSLIILAVINLFIGNHKSYRVQEALSRSQENIRYAIDTMTENVRDAGYTGCGNLFPRPAAAAPLLLESAPLSYTDTTLVVGAAGNGTIGITGTDVVSIMAATTCGALLTADASVINGAGINVSGFNCNAGAASRLLISDCDSGQIFVLGGAVTSGVIPVAGAPGGAEVFLNGLAEVFVVDTKSYFLRQRNGSPVRSLYETVSGAPAVELVEGIDDLQIRYGVDANLDDIVDLPYVAGSGVTSANRANIISVKVYMLTVSATDNLLETMPTAAASFTMDDGVVLTASATDRRLRRPFMTTISLRNRVD